MSADASLVQENIESILHGITIPSPPQIIADLQMEMAMPDPDLNEVAAMISKDPGLAGGVLKTLNSPFYGHSDITSISKGVMMLGMGTITSIVNTLYLRDSMANSDDVSDELYKAMTCFWDTATDVARACSIVAQKIHFRNPDFAYMLGLFHNAGIPLMMQRFPDYAKVVAESYKLEADRIVDIENAHFKTNHAVLSFYAARSWKLPKILCQVISEHHNAASVFSEADKHDPEVKTYLAILKLAEHLAGLSITLGNNTDDLEWNQIAEQILDHLDLTSFDLDDLVGTAEEYGINAVAYIM